MPRSKWVDTLKTVQDKIATPVTTHESSSYKKRGTNLALDVDDEPYEDEDEWTFAKEVYGQDVEVVHEIKLRQEGGIDACLRSKFDLNQCYKARISLQTPHLKLDTADVLQRIFPNQIANGAVRGGHIMNILGFDRFFRSIETGCSVFDLYMHDGSLALQSYAGNYGGRGNLRPLHSHYPLEIIDTPEWIWTPEKP